MQPIVFACTFVVAVLLYAVCSFIPNIRRVRHLSVPKIYNPLCTSNRLWVVIQPLVLPLIRLLPFSPGRWVKYSRWGWEFGDRCQTHTELGDVFMLVTPSMNWMYVADAGLVSEIFQRRDDFRRPLQLYSMVNVFGPNIITTDAHDWSRHRKITGAAFTERNHRLAWSESLRQASEMLHSWTSQGPKPITTTVKDTRTLAFNVLAHVGFRKFYSFDGKEDGLESQDWESFRQALAFCLNNALLTLVVPPRLLTLPFLPSKWRQLGKSMHILRTYLKGMYEKEKSDSSQEVKGPANLMRLMVKSSEQAVREASHDAEKACTSQSLAKRQGLSPDEIIGNIFAYYFAGHDTTAATFAYCFFLLSAYPDVQDWIAEELHAVLPNTPSSEWSCEELFPKLKRCLTIMLETIRLYDPLPGMPKWTGDKDRTVQYNGQTLVIPARTFVMPSMFAVHTHPRYWGPDAVEWRPSRWIVPDPAAPTTSTPTPTPDTVPRWSKTETLFTPAKGTYFPWSEGQRNCPGKKFSQVEFVAGMAIIFRDWRVAPVELAGETAAQARARALEVVNDSSVKLLLSMNDPGRLELRWERREGAGGR